MEPIVEVFHEQLNKNV